MNDRHNYAFFSDIVTSKTEASKATNETSESAADPIDNHAQPERNEPYNSDDGWQS